SSQVSPSSASTTPLPQFRVHPLGSPPQVHPDSTAQALEQPSSPVVPPSSHPSPGSSTAFPQVGAQTLGLPAQLQPASTLHVLEQPSPLAPLPSSHASPRWRT